MRMPHQIKLIEVICLGFVGVFLLAALLPAQNAARDMAMRVHCAENLRLIGRAINAYSNNENRNGLAFPRVKFNVPDMDHPTFFTASKQPNSFGEGAPVNDVTASFYLLFKTQDLKPQVLVCPATNKQAMSFGDERPAPAHPLAASKTDLSNFPSMDYVSYSIENMIPSAPALSGGWKWNAAISAEYVLLGDLNPGGRAVTTVKPNSAPNELAAANSPDHNRTGQNVLFGDLHVDFATTPFCGAKMDDGTQDNIYCRRAGAPGDPIVGPPMDRFDTVLLPAADYKPAK